MKHFLILLLTLLSTTLFSQDIMNGDLEDTISIISTPPAFWEIVPHYDINCLATDTIMATPDLSSLNGPITGVPYSGNSYVSGLHAEYDLIVWQEGIKQSISGFNIGTEYAITFYQTVMHNTNCVDSFGSWNMYLNDSIIGTTDKSKLGGNEDNFTLNWEKRSINFVAFEEDFIVKFLPWNDDAIDYQCVIDDLKHLRMGIDSISLDFSTRLTNNVATKDILVYPSPVDVSFRVKVGLNQDIKMVQIFDLQGNLLFQQNEVENEEAINVENYLESGLYIMAIFLEQEMYTRKILKM